MLNEVRHRNTPECVTKLAVHLVKSARTFLDDLCNDRISAHGKNDLYADTIGITANNEMVSFVTNEKERGILVLKGIQQLLNLIKDLFYSLLFLLFI